MSKLKSMKKQIARNNNKFLGQYESQLAPNWMGRPQSERDIVASMARNGITVDDLARERREGWNAAYQQTAPVVQKLCYSAFATVLVDEFGFSPDDCFKDVWLADQKVATIIDFEDALQEMQEKAHIQFQSDEGVERVVKI